MVQQHLTVQASALTELLAEAGRLRARFAPTDLAGLTGKVASMFRSAAEEAGLTLTVDAPPQPEPV